MKTTAMNIILFSTLLLSLTVINCKKDERRGGHIYVKNNSANSIYYIESFSFPDTTLKQDNKPTPGNKVNVGEEGAIIAGKGVFYLNKNFQIFIFDASTIESQPWDSIALKYNILKRYMFTENDLEKMNWTITYP